MSINKSNRVNVWESIVFTFTCTDFTYVTQRPQKKTEFS